LAACVREIYSASVVDSATVPCFFELHVIQALSMMHVYPEIDFALAQFAKLASENISSFSRVSAHLNNMPSSQVPFK